MRIILTLAFVAIISLTASSQDVQKTKIENQTQDQTFSCAYIKIENKILTKKLKVDVDFGDTPEQIKTGKEYSEKLTNKISVASVLNYMFENQFELVQTLDLNSTYQGTGGTSGIIFIMRKKK